MIPEPIPQNPFIVGGAISDPLRKGFYGREDVFHFVRSALTAAHRPPILLVGQRRIGKSSILRQLPAALPPEWACVYYDLQGRAELTLNEVLFGLGRAVADALQIPRPTEEQATAETFPQFLEKAIVALDSLPERLILLFDEFDVIDQQFAAPEIAARRFVPYLADLIARQPRVGYILVAGRKTEELSDTFLSGILKDSVQSRIGRLQWKQVDRMVRDSFGTNIEISDSAVQEIFTLTAGHPYCVQVLCYTIWNRYYEGNRAQPIGPDEVSESVPVAVQLGTNGLNWIYDGLEKPAHRLFLAALAMLAGPQGRFPVSYFTIEKELLERRVGVDASELQVVPRDLQGWDVIEGTTAGFVFSVPMIGTWIQKNRPLQELEQSARLINPRAAKYYELAVDSQQRGDLEAAIQDFRNALAANPVYIEAQVGLASALRIRNEPGDLDAAIEGYRRVLEIDPNSMRTPLLEVLVENLESNPGDVELAVSSFKEIQNVDTDGIFLSRARRAVEHMAQIRAKYGRYLDDAVSLFEVLGDEASASQARLRKSRFDRIQNRFMALWFGTSVLWLFAVLARQLTVIQYVTPYLQILLASSASMFIYTSIGFSIGSGLNLKTLLRMLGSIATGFVAAYFAYRRGWIHSLWWLGGLSFVAASPISIASTPEDVPAEIKRKESRERSTTDLFRLRELSSRVLESWAAKLNPRGSRSSNKER